jgi:hypothetical protein
MRRRLVAGGVLAALFVSVMAAMPGAAAAPSGSAGSYIVVLKDSASPSTVARAHADRYGARVGHVYRYALKGYSATLSSDRVAALRADPERRRGGAGPAGARDRPDAADRHRPDRR